MADRIAVVVGTRPEIIKMAEIIHLLGDRVLLVHTGQHWDHAMSGTFLKQLALPQPHVSLAVGGSSRAQQIAATLGGLEQVLMDERPAAVMVQGDTNTVIGAALAANSVGVPLVHVEAGLRSFDRQMPEEHNRVITDHLSDLCLAPTENSAELLLAEGIPHERIRVTGNTIVAAVQTALDGSIASRRELLAAHDLTDAEFILATVHRPENTDTPESLNAVFGALGTIASKTGPVVVPLHPRTRARLEHFDLAHLLRPLIVMSPLGYDDFVGLASQAAVVVSDSGGIQEEASVWKRPVVVVRRSTERPEGLGTFSHLTRPGEDLLRVTLDIYEDRHDIHHQLGLLPSPYGDASAARTCLQAVDQLLRTERP